MVEGGGGHRQGATMCNIFTRYSKVFFENSIMHNIGLTREMIQLVDAFF